MLSLAPITIFTDGAHTIDYLQNCVFWTNTIGKICKIQKKYSQFVTILKKSRKILVRPKKEEKRSLYGFGSKIRKKYSKSEKNTPDIRKNNKPQKNTRKLGKYSRKILNILVRPKKRSSLPFG